MKIVNCKKPRLIKNKYTQEMIYVPCGCCSVCRNRYTLQWKQRLLQEFNDNGHAVFFTLTYKSSKVPLAYLNDGELYSDDWDETLNVSHLLASSSEFSEYMSSRSSFPFAIKSDIQKFMKRLRKQCSKYYDTKIRYYIVSEYGPKTYRPHYHGVLWYDGDRLTKDIRKLINRCWQLGFVDSKFANSSSSDYVSTYVTGSVGLPLLYTLKPFKPFVLASRCKPIGFKNFGEDSEFDMFKDGSIFHIRKDKKGEHEELLPEYYRNKLFPKCVGYNDLTDSLRSTLYKIAFPYDYDIETAHTEYKVVPIDSDNVTLSFHNGLTHDEYSREFTNGAFSALLSMSNRIYKFCKNNHLSFDDWYKTVKKFHSRLDMYCLNEQLSFQETFKKNNPVLSLSPLYHLYPKNMVKDIDKYELLVNHGFELFDIDSETFDYRLTAEYQSMVAISDKIILDGIKVKSHNDMKSYDKCKSLLGYSEHYFGSS